MLVCSQGRPIISQIESSFVTAALEPGRFPGEVAQRRQNRAALDNGGGQTETAPRLLLDSSGRRGHDPVVRQTLPLPREDVLPLVCIQERFVWAARRQEASRGGVSNGEKCTSKLALNDCKSHKKLLQNWATLSQYD